MTVIYNGVPFMKKSFIAMVENQEAELFYLQNKKHRTIVLPADTVEFIVKARSEGDQIAQFMRHMECLACDIGLFSIPAHESYDIRYSEDAEGSIVIRSLS